MTSTSVLKGSNDSDANKSKDGNVAIYMSAAASAPIHVGCTVEVARRMWPGINQPGGTGRVLFIHSRDDTIAAVDVHYLVEGRKEKRVPIQYVTYSPENSFQDNGRRMLRDRNQLLGRCSTCGSLRADCGACDWREMDDIVMANEQPEVQSKVCSSSSSSENGSSSDDDDLLNRRLPWLLSTANSSKKLHDFLHDELFQDKPRRNLKRRNANQPSILETIGYSSSAETRPNFGRKPNTTPPMKKSVGETQTLDESDDKNLLVSPIRKRKLKPAKSRSPDESSEEVVFVGTNKEKTNTVESSESEKSSVNKTNETDASLSSDSIVEDEVSISSSDDDGNLVISAMNKKQNKEDGGSSSGHVPSSSPYKDYYEHGDQEDELFIRPEGELLPKDIQDRTANIAFDDLPAFFDELASEIQNVLLPDFSMQLTLLQRHFSDEQSESFNQKMRQALIRDGTDQLDFCLKRISMRRKEAKKLQNEQR